MTKQVYATFATSNFANLNGGIIKGSYDCEKLEMRIVSKERYGKLSLATLASGNTGHEYYGVVRRLKNGLGWLVVWVNHGDGAAKMSNYLVAAIIDRTNALYHHNRLLSLKHESTPTHPHRSSKGKIRHWSYIYGHPTQAS